jgi:L-iditol 2-dehydrogenase
VTTLAPDELQVEIEAAVVGPPELAALSTEPSSAERARGAVAPGTAGVGRVVAAGAAAAHRVGERVLVGPVQACGECDVCRRGHMAVCPARVRLGVDRPGTLGGEVVVRARVTLGLGGPLADAAGLAGPAAALLPREAALSYELLVRAGVAAGEVTVWLGGGPVAALGQALAQAKGALGLAPTAAELALEPAEAALALRARLAETGAGGAPLRVYEVSGRADARARAVALAGPGATLGLLGAEVAGAPETPDLPSALVDRDVVILGVAGPHPDLLPELAALVARGDLELGSRCEVRGWDELTTLRAAPGGGERALVLARAG